MFNIALVSGVVRTAPTEHVSIDGDRVVSFDVSCRTSDTAVVVPVTWRPHAARVPNVGDAVVIGGATAKRFFRTGGATVARTELAAQWVLPGSQRRRITTKLAEFQAAIEALNQAIGSHG